MRRVVVDMQNALFADAIAAALQKFDSGFEVHQKENEHEDFLQFFKKSAKTCT